jgi:multisubunit Na+/H+ antiporter MnhE subunit
MGILLSLVVGLVLWIVLWALGVKAFDAFMLLLGILVVAAAAHVLAPFLPGNRREPERRSGPWRYKV